MARRPCSICGEPVDDRARGTYREITGWERVRDAGGANAITVRRETGRVACPPCIARVKSGVAPTQGRLV